MITLTPTDGQLRVVRVFLDGTDRYGDLLCHSYSEGILKFSQIFTRSYVRVYVVSQRTSGQFCEIWNLKFKIFSESDLYMNLIQFLSLNLKELNAKIWNSVLKVHNSVHGPKFKIFQALWFQFQYLIHKSESPHHNLNQSESIQYSRTGASPSLKNLESV